MRWGLLVIVLTAGLLSGLQVVAQEGDRPPPEDAVPVTPPLPSYPPMAAFLGIQGYCEVRFDVDERGYAFNLFTSCTEYVFCYQSKKSVSAVTFVPAYEGGAPRVRTNVVYPLEYRLEGFDSASIDRSRIKPCRKVPIS